MKKIQKLFYTIKFKSLLFVFTFLFCPTLFFAQEATETISYSSYQFAKKSCGFSPSPCSFNQGFTEIIHVPGTAGSYQTTNARYLFNHPNFKNSAIKMIILEIKVNKIYTSTGGDAIMLIKMPFNSSNNAIPWSGFPDYEALFSCNKNGNIIFQDGLGTSNLSPTTFNLLIYNQAGSSFTSQTLNSADPNGNSLTIAFDPFVGGLEISSAKIIVTYNCTVPSSVPTLNASSSSTSSVNLSWSGVSGATAYEIYNCTTNQIVATPSSTSYTVNGLNQGTAYTYKVRAKNNCGVSAFSDCKTATTTGCSSAPSSVSSFTASNITTSSVNVSWPSVSGATSYEIYNCDTNQIAATSSTTNTTLNGLNEGTQYNFKIRAKNSCGTSAFTSCIAVTTVSNCTSAPSTPSSLTATQQSNTSISLSWPSVSGATAYEIYNCTTNQITTTTNAVNYTVNSLTQGNTYSYKVRAKNSCGLSAFTNCTLTTINILGCAVPPAPTSLASTIISSRSVQLTWDAIPVPDYEKFEIYNCDTNTLLAETYSNNFVVLDQTVNLSYNYKVRVKNNCGNYSAFSNCVTAMTSVNDGVGCDTPILATPVITTLQTYVSNTMLRWSMVPNATQYYIYDYQTRRLVTTSFSTSAVIPNVDNIGFIAFVVKAVNQCGTSDFSTPQSNSIVYASHGVCSSYSATLTPNAPVVTVDYNQIFLDLSGTDYGVFDAYEVYCCETGQLLGLTGGTRFMIPRNLLNPNQPSYTFKIRGKDLCNDYVTAYYSKFSSCSNVFQPVCNPNCLMPFTERRTNSILFYWNDQINYEYEIFDATTNQLVGTSVNGFFTIDNLQPSTVYPYKFRRKAFQNCSVSAFTSVYNASTLGCRNTINFNNSTALNGYFAAINVTLTNSTTTPSYPLVIKAQESITLLPGTHFQTGSNNTLKIENCIMPLSKQANLDPIATVENSNENPISNNSIENQDQLPPLENTGHITPNETIENVLLEYKFNIPGTQSKLIVYPTPTKNILNIALTEEFVGGQLVLYSMSNELLLEKKAVNISESIDLTPFASGLYILKCKKNEVEIYSKVVKL